MATAIIDMSDLVPEDGEEPDPPRIQWGESIIMLPPHAPLSYIQKLALYFGAYANGSAYDKNMATAELSAELARLVPELDGNVPFHLILKAVQDAYRLEKEPASSD